MPFKTNRLAYLCVIFTLPLSPTASAQDQNNTADSLFYQATIATLRNNYNTTMGPSTHLCTGQEYIPNGQKAEGTPFFSADKTGPNLVFFDGTLYKEPDLRYDEVADQLIINTGAASIQLVKEKVTFFSIAGHDFHALQENKTATSGMTPGFYEQLYSAPSITLYARREKKLVFPSRAEDQLKYVQIDTWYLEFQHTLYRVDGQHTLLKILNDKKDQLKKFIKDNDLHFGKRLEESFIRSIAYYAQLKN
jgi:hypothetical protein